ncbi:MAG: metallophosphoesterase [Bacillota bacterium]|nr:metallophosphoesterase [Bacillota bacterium]
MTVDILILTFAAILVALLLRAIWEPTRIEVTRIQLPVDSPDDGDDNRTGSISVLRVLFFSDLHMDYLRIREKHLMQAVRGLTPDLILFGGDLTAKQSCLHSAIALLARLRQQPGLSQAPLVAVPGNHDTPEGITAMAQAGFTVLQNQDFQIHCHDQSWQIIGLQDKRLGCPDAAAALQSARMAGIPPQQRIVLVHNPDSLLDVPPGQADWFCAGHFHGGQIWMPFRLEFRLLRDEKLPRTGLYKGLISWGDMTGYISRGLGCVLFPLRFRSVPELVYLEFKAQDF